MNPEVSNPFLGTIRDRDHTYQTLITLCNVNPYVVRLLHFARTLKMTDNSCFYNQCKYIRVPLIETKARGVIQESSSSSFAFLRGNRRDVLAPNLYHPPARHHLLLLNFRSAIKPCGGRLPLTAGEEHASHLLEIAKVVEPAAFEFIVGGRNLWSFSSARDEGAIVR